MSIAEYCKSGDETIWPAQKRAPTSLSQVVDSALNGERLRFHEGFCKRLGSTP
jgi:hypothetical protein